MLFQLKKYNQYKIICEIFCSFFKRNLWNPVCILCSQYVAIESTFQVLSGPFVEADHFLKA